MNKYEKYVADNKKTHFVSDTTVYCRVCALAIWVDAYPNDDDLAFFDHDGGYRLKLDEENAFYVPLPATCGH